MTPRTQEVKDTTWNRDYYLEFYDELGRKYPETEIIHSHRKRSGRYNTVLRELMPHAYKNEKLLDVGCNDGVYTVPYCEIGGRALGIDISPSLVREASRKGAHVKSSCSFIQADIEDPNVASVIDGEFDLALCSEVLEHLTNPRQALRNVHDVLRSSGSLILTSPTALTAFKEPILRSTGIQFFKELLFRGARYACATLTKSKLLEPVTIKTTDVIAYSGYGISSYLYRHDGYYPRALRQYVEMLGFKCIRSYTIDFFTPIMFASRKGRLRIGQQFDHKSLRNIDQTTVSALMDQAQLLEGSFREPAEFLLRRIPVVNLFGMTNFTVFRRL